MPRKKKIEDKVETQPEVKATPVNEELATPVVEEKVEAPKEAKAPKEKTPKLDPKKGFFFGSGRRKTATARARLYLATQEVMVKGKKLEKGDVYVNGNPIDTYFNDAVAKAAYTEVYRTTNTSNRFITTVVTSGSGKSGQLGATVLAISKALVSVDPKFKTTLRKKGFMTRDPRMKERKKPGLMGARKQKSSPKR